MTEEVKDTETPEQPERPWLHRILHSLAEAIGVFVFGGGLFMVGANFLCLNNSGCNNFGAIVFWLFSFLVTIFVCGFLVKYFTRFRNRPNARKNLDIAVGVAAVILWVVYFNRFEPGYFG